MQTNQQQAIKKLQELEARAALLEAQAKDIRTECSLTRALLEGGVSTRPQKSKGNPAVVAKALAGRKAFLDKQQKTRQVVTAGQYS